MAIGCAASVMTYYMVCLSVCTRLEDMEEPVVLAGLGFRVRVCEASTRPHRMAFALPTLPVPPSLILVSGLICCAGV